MAERRNRYYQLQQTVTLALLGALVLFIFYWIAAGNEIVWLKVILSILIFAICAACLGYLFITQELLRPRSLWMTLGAAAIAVCLLFSLIFHFPCPNPRMFPMQAAEDLATALTSTL